MGKTVLMAGQSSKSANIRRNPKHSFVINGAVLSVVIPTYNRAHQLDRCLNSLFKQTYPLWKYEVIVIDDNSRDNTPKVLEKYLKKYPAMQVIRNYENKGSNYARTVGVRRAKAKVVIFTDSDCILPPNWLSKIAKKFENKKILCVQGTQECKGKWGKFMYQREDTLVFYKKRRTLDTKNLAIRKEIFLQYNFDPKMQSAGDYELGQRLSKDIDINYDPNIVVFHVSNDFSGSIRRGKNWGKAQGYIYKKYGWEGVNPKFRYPLIFLFFYYLGGLFFFSLKYRSLRGGIAFFTTTFLTAYHFKKSIAHIKLQRKIAIATSA